MPDEPTEVKVYGISPPYRVTSVAVEGYPNFTTRYTLYRNETEITAVNVRYLNETDAVANRLREMAALYEAVRVETLAVIETVREAERADA